MGAAVMGRPSSPPGCLGPPGGHPAHPASPYPAPTSKPCRPRACDPAARSCCTLGIFRGSAPSRWPHVGAGPWEELLRDGAPLLNWSPLGALGTAAGSEKNGSDTRATEAGGRDCTRPGEGCALPFRGPTAGCPCGWALDQEAGNRDRDVHLREGRVIPQGTPTPAPGSLGKPGEVPNGGGCLHVGPGKAPGERGHPHGTTSQCGPGGAER